MYFFSRTLLLLTIFTGIASCLALSHTNHITPADTQLLDAIEQNSPNAVRKALADGANVNRRLERNNTPLIQACGNGFNRELIHPDTPGCCHGHSDGTEPWLIHNNALLQERRVIIQLLLQAGADVNARNDNGRSALLHACILNDDAEKLQLLINAGADVHVADNDGRTPMMEANVEDNGHACMKILRAAGARL